MKKHVNLYDEYLKQQKNVKTTKTGNIKYVAILIFVGLITGTYGAKLMLDRNLMSNDIASLTSYVTNASHLEQVKKAEDIQQDINTMKNLTTALNNISTVFDAKQTITGSMIKSITDLTPSNISIKNIGFNGAMLTLVVSSTSNDGPSQFVQKLEALDFVSSVDYKGYSSSGDGFVSTFSILLKGDF